MVGAGEEMGEKEGRGLDFIVPNTRSTKPYKFGSLCALGQNWDWHLQWMINYEAVYMTEH